MRKDVLFVLWFMGTLCSVFADGFVPMRLWDVLLDIDAIILVEIIENEQTMEHREPKAGVPNSEAFAYRNEIKSKVLSTHLGEFEGTQYNTTYVKTLYRGSWVLVPSSGLEQRMRPGERYVLLLNGQAGTRRKLTRAEGAGSLAEILQLRRKLEKKMEEEERRIAEAQARVPDGIYRISRVPGGQQVRTCRGLLYKIGEEFRPDIVNMELRRARTFVVLTLTLGSEPYKGCILMLGGRAFMLNQCAADPPPPPPATGELLLGFLKTPEEVEAVAAYFGIPVLEEEPPAGNE